MSDPMWVMVGSRADLEHVRRQKSADVIVTRAGTPIYGRPGERLCVWLADGDVTGNPRSALARLPLRAGVCVPATEAGLAVLAEAKLQKRGPLAVRASSARDVQAGVAAGAEFVVVPSPMDGVPPGVQQIVEGSTLALSVDDGSRSSSAAGTTTAMARGTIGAALESAVKQAGGREALVHVGAGHRRTYRQLADDVHRIARALVGVGIKHGDRVAVYAGNVAEWPAIQLATAAIGGIVVPVNPSLRGEELAYVLRQSGSAVMLAAPRADERHRSELAALLTSPDAPRIAVGIGSVSAPGLMPWAEFLQQGASLQADRLRRAMASPRPEDCACILYTSGTTGVPKGAMLTHRGMLQNAAGVGAALRMSASDRICLPVPLHHCFGCVMGTLGALVHQATLVMPGERFDAAQVVAAVEKERCTVLYGVPTMFHAELEHEGHAQADLSSLRTGIIAGAPVDPELARQVQRGLRIPALTVAYGLTEASPVVTQTTVDDAEEVRLGTVGRPIPGATVKAVDPRNGRTLPAGQRGELCTRGPMVMRGYWQMPDETRAAIDAGGWLHTGDLAVRDAHGCWRIEGRIKDMIIRAGENVYPAEVEAILRRHPAVADAAVVGIPSDYYGEEVFAWIRPRAGVTVSGDELRNHLMPHLASFKLPKAFAFADRFPMTESGKVLKTALREMAVAQPSGGAASFAVAPHVTEAAAPVTLPWLEAKTDLLSPLPASVPEASPRPGWKRPEQPTWTATTVPASEKQKEKTVPATTTTSNGRKRGKRIKPWGIGTNVREQIESTGERPIMYQALGTPPRSEHPFNLYNDIRSQPDALSGTFETAHEAVEVARRITDRRPDGVIGLGSGTSQYVAQVANAAFARFAGLPGWDFDSLAFLRYTPPVDFKKLAVMAYSGSGSTVDTVAAARRSKEAGAYTVSFTSVEGSPVVQATDSRILTSGGFDTGGSDTFHYTARVAAAIYLALELGKLRRPEAIDYAALQRQLLETPRMMADRLDAIDARCRTIAERFHKVRGILVVGAGSNYGTAEEIALKFDEMSHIPAKPMMPGRHIHGALGLTDEAILTVLVAPPGPGYEDMVTIAKVTSMLKTPAVAIVSDDDTQIGELVDYVVRLPLNDETLFAVLAVLPGQLLPYWCGVLLGLNPDTQRSNIPKYARVWNMLFPAETH